jgi:hypothetical protein
MNRTHRIPEIDVGSTWRIAILLWLIILVGALVRGGAQVDGGRSGPRNPLCLPGVNSQVEGGQRAELDALPNVQLAAPPAAEPVWRERMTLCKDGPSAVDESLQPVAIPRPD